MGEGVNEVGVQFASCVGNYHDVRWPTSTGGLDGLHLTLDQWPGFPKVMLSR